MIFSGAEYLPYTDIVNSVGSGSWCISEQGRAVDRADRADRAARKGFRGLC